MDVGERMKTKWIPKVGDYVFYNFPGDTPHIGGSVPLEVGALMRDKNGVEITEGSLVLFETFMDNDERWISKIICFDKGKYYSKEGYPEDYDVVVMWENWRRLPSNVEVVTEDKALLLAFEDSRVRLKF